jgi:AAHS family 3-hydroxyphenylpropionic acid transporter
MDRDSGRGRTTILLLCFLAALLEGVDIQSMGLAAPKLGAEFGLGPAQLGYAATASVLGLFLGAGVGGRLADRIGRKAVLLGALVALGVFSLATAFARDLPSLLAIRVLAGIGMGGAFPNLIAIANEAAGPRSRALAVAVMYCGMPFGGGLAGLMVFFGGAAMDWRAIFYVGGLGPLALVPLLIWLLPESARFREALAAQGAVANRATVGTVLFGEGRAVATLTLWVAYFFTLLVVYLLVNWIPSLMVAKGLTRAEGALVSAVVNFGAVVGALIFGRAMDRGQERAVVIVMYVGMAAALAALAVLNGMTLMLAAGCAAGFFAIGGQVVLYALAPRYYGVLIRGAGVGAAVAAGRLGSMTGPLMGGALLQAGFGANAVLAGAIPGMALAAIAAVILLRQPAAGD